MANENQNDPKALTGNRFYDDPEVRARTQNEGHRNLLVDALVARTILENLPPTSSDENEQWARQNVAHTKQVLADYENRGYRYPDSPQIPDKP
jgi:hypothetical protein